MKRKREAMVRLWTAMLLVVAVVSAVPMPAAHAADQVVINTDDDGAGSLRQAIADADPGDTITFDLDSYPATITLLTGELLIDEDLTITGPGAEKLIISGDSGRRVFNITDGTVEISGLTIAKGWVTGDPAQGGGIRNAGTLMLQRVVLIDNRAEGDLDGGSAYGGGVYNESGLTVEDSTIRGNTAQGGAGTAGPAGNACGGGITNGGNGELTVRRSRIIDNAAQGGSATMGEGGGAAGGGICDQGIGPSGNPSATGASLADRERTNTGRSITAPQTLTIEGSFVNGNSAKGGDGDDDGGAAFGGGLDFLGGTLAVQNSVLDDNIAQGGTGATGDGGNSFGGGINARGIGLMTGCSLSGNKAQGGEGTGDAGGLALGGGLSAEDTFTIHDCSIHSNESVGGDGAGAGGEAWGGGVRASLSVSMTITGSTFRRNTAEGGAGDSGPDGASRGGGLSTLLSAVFEPQVTLVNCTFSGNWAASGEEGLGGGLFAGPAATIEVSFCTIAYNRADDQGGGIYSATDVNDTGPVIKNTIVHENTAPFGPNMYNRVQSRGYNLIEDTIDAFFDASPPPNTNEGNRLAADAKLGPLQDNGGPMLPSGGAPWTHALLSDSVAVDNGSPTDIDGMPVQTDERGFGRPYPGGGEHDMGAYERGVADLGLLKEGSATDGQWGQAIEAVPGETVTFTLTISNSGYERGSGVVLSDTIPVSLTNPAVVSSTVMLTDTGASPPFVWQVADIIPGHIEMITFTAVLSSPLAQGVFTNTAIVTTTEVDDDPRNNLSSVLITVLEKPSGFVYLPLVLRNY